MEDKLTNQEEQLRVMSEDFSLDIDTSELWNKVEAQLPPIHQERRRPIFWWFASVFALVIIAIFMWNYQSIAEQKEVIADISVETSNPTDLSYSDDKSTKQTSSKQSNIKQPKITSSDNTHTEKSLFPANSTVQTHSQSSSANEIKVTIPTSQVDKLQVVKETIPTIFNSNRYDEKSTLRNEGLINRSSIVQSSIDALIIPSSEKMKIEEIQKFDQTRDFLSHNRLGLILLDPLEINTELSIPSREIKPLKHSRWLPYFSVSSGVTMHSSTIYTDYSEELDLTQFDNERSLLGLSTDMHFGYESSSGWRFGLGLNHNRLVNRYTQVESVTESTEITGNTTSKIDDNGEVSNNSGLLIQNTVTSYDLNWHRTHDFINAQLIIGKRILRKGNFTLFADGSIGRNIWSNHTGYYFTEGNSTIDKFESSDDHPYTSGGYNLGIDLSLEYEINEFSISLRPFTVIGLNSITQNTNYYQLKNSLYGVQLGVVYRP